MNEEQKMKLFQDVFAPKPNERILFIVDTPHDAITDTETWKDRRTMAKEWYDTFHHMGKEKNLHIDWLTFPATGTHNTPIPAEITKQISHYDLILALTQYSLSSSMLPLIRGENSHSRGASMPLVERRMEQTAFQADYTKVKQYALAIQKMLKKTDSADVHFSTGNHLHLDLRNRPAHADTGECIKPGQGINFPSGEAYKTPYEAVGDEKTQFGESKTNGTMPVHQIGETYHFIIKHNTIQNVEGTGKKAEEMRQLFTEKTSRRNIAELGIGCNPNAVVTGNPLEDEKVGGLHIAYGQSSHLGGKIQSDLHIDICYPKGLPVSAETLTLHHTDGSSTDIIKNGQLQYQLLQ